MNGIEFVIDTTLGFCLASNGSNMYLILQDNIREI